MKHTHSKEDKWDSKELGASEEHVRKASAKREKELDERLGLQTISIRLQKSLIDDLKYLAEEDGIGYQPYVRQWLTRHVREAFQEKKNKATRRKHQHHVSTSR